jgi:hypothetical protein
MTEFTLLIALATGAFWSLIPAAASLVGALVAPRRIGLRASLILASLIVLLLAPVVSTFAPSSLHRSGSLIDLRASGPTMDRTEITVGSAATGGGAPANREHPADAPLATSAPSAPSASAATSPAAAPGADLVTASSGPSSPARSAVAWRLLYGLWLVGASAVAGYYIIGHARMRRIVARSRAMSHRRGARYDCRITGELRSPCAYGLLRPIILLPRRFVLHDRPDMLRAVVLHEEEHLLRGDQWARLLSELVVALYWWYPPAWVLRRELIVAAEHSADASAARRFRDGRHGTTGRKASRTESSGYAGELARALLLADGRNPARVAPGAGSAVRRRLRRLRIGPLPSPSRSGWRLTLPVAGIIAIAAAGIPVFASGGSESDAAVALLSLPADASVAEYREAAAASRATLPSPPSPNVAFDRVTLDEVEKAGPGLPIYEYDLYGHDDRLVAEVSFTPYGLRSSTVYLRTPGADEAWGFILNEDGAVVRVTREIRGGEDTSVVITYLPDGEAIGEFRRTNVDPRTGSRVTRHYLAPNRLHRRTVETAVGSVTYDGDGNVVSRAEAGAGGSVVEVDSRGDVVRTIRHRESDVAEFEERLTNALRMQAMRRAAKDVDGVSATGLLNLFGTVESVAPTGEGRS